MIDTHALDEAVRRHWWLLAHCRNHPGRARYLALSYLAEIQAEYRQIVTKERA